MDRLVTCELLRLDRRSFTRSVIRNDPYSRWVIHTPATPYPLRRLRRYLSQTVEGPVHIRIEDRSARTADIQPTVLSIGRANHATMRTGLGSVGGEKDQICNATTWFWAVID